MRELWEHRSEEENGETQEDRDLSLYRRFEGDARRYEPINRVMEELRVSIGKYAEAVTRLSSVRMGKLDKDTIKASDSHRRLMHNSLIDTLNRLSREYKKLNLDNSWLSDIIGLSREEVGTWALTIARKELNHE